MLSIHDISDKLKSSDNHTIVDHGLKKQFSYQLNKLNPQETKLEVYLDCKSKQNPKQITKRVLLQEFKLHKYNKKLIVKNLYLAINNYIKNI